MEQVGSLANYGNIDDPVHQSLGGDFGKYQEPLSHPCQGHYKGVGGTPQSPQSVGSHMGESLNGLFDNIVNGTEAFSEGASVILSKDVNKVVRECYLKSKPVNENGVPMRGYRQRMFRVWQEIGL